MLGCAGLGWDVLGCTGLGWAGLYCAGPGALGASAVTVKHDRGLKFCAAEMKVLGTQTGLFRKQDPRSKLWVRNLVKSQSR